MNSPELLAVYGALPADPALQQPFIDTINKQFPGITLNWDVPKAMLSYPDVPNHQAWVPDYAKSKKALAGIPEQVPHVDRGRYRR